MKLLIDGNLNTMENSMMLLVIGEIYELDVINKKVTWIINSNDLENK